MTPLTPAELDALEQKASKAISVASSDSSWARPNQYHASPITDFIDACSPEVIQSLVQQVRQSQETSQRLARERDEARRERAEILGLVQRFQPAGSPPPFGTVDFIAWVLDHLRKPLEKAEAERDEALAAVAGMRAAANHLSGTHGKALLAVVRAAEAWEEATRWQEGRTARQPKEWDAICDSTEALHAAVRAWKEARA